jgi:septal ring factor EnvC (AmiA/AmiB activator)
MSSQIESAATAVAVARANAATAQRSLVESQGARKRLSDRLTAIKAERDAIVAARRAGDSNPDHGVRIEVLAADESDLSGLLAKADGEVSRASTVAAEAQASLARAEQFLAVAADESLLAKLTAHATALDGLMVRTIAEISTITARRGGRPVWYPSPEMATAVSRLHMTAMGIRR